MRVYSGDTFAEVYRRALAGVYVNPDYETYPRGQKIKEISNVALVFDPKFSLYENERRSSQFNYIAGELIWYFMGKNDIDFISKYSKFWKHLDNGDGTVNSAYGNLIFTERNEFGYSQWDWALNSLTQDKDTRQAILHFNKPSHQYLSNKDFVCTLNAVFQIRNDELNLTVDMRSNDLILGTPTDVAFFTVLQQQMLNHLKDYYPNIKLGKYTHIVHSIHLYEKHFSLVKEMLGKEFIPMAMPTLNNNLVDKNGIPSPELVQIFNNIETKGNTYEDKLLDWISEHSYKYINKTKNEQV
jgi:thymidylate synthase